MAYILYGSRRKLILGSQRIAAFTHSNQYCPFDASYGP